MNDIQFLMQTIDNVNENPVLAVENKQGKSESSKLKIHLRGGPKT